MIKQTEKIIYQAIIATGSTDDYYEDTVFCSFDKYKVEKWISRLNKIIENNRERIDNLNIQSDVLPFWYEFIKYYEPNVIIRETIFR